MESWVAIVGGLTIILGALAAFWRWCWPFLRRVGHFLDDWFGEPSRPGFAATPGVMERLARVEHEVHTNNGSSMRDAVNRIEQSLTSTGDEQKAMWSAIEAIAKSTPPEEP